MLQEKLPMTPMRLMTGPLLANSYILCEDDCVLVDPAGDVEDILRVLRGRNLRFIVATHMHFDHIWSAKALVDSTGADFLVHRLDWELRDEFLSMAEELGFRPPAPPDRAEFVEDGQTIWHGLRIMHTPGHTPGSISLVGSGFILTGDLLFNGSVGRTDLLASDSRALASSICRIYREIPHHYVVYPGHGPPTTVGAEATGNPFLRASSCSTSS